MGTLAHTLQHTRELQVEAEVTPPASGTDLGSDNTFLYIAGLMILGTLATLLGAAYASLE